LDKWEVPLGDATFSSFQIKLVGYSQFYVL
jgi:hypothetical protein